MSADAFGAMALTFGAVCAPEIAPVPAHRPDRRKSTPLRAPGAPAPVLRKASLRVAIASLFQR